MLPTLASRFVPSEIPEEGEGLAFIGEAPGYYEAKNGRPLVGESGKLFNRWLEHNDIKREDCLVGNVFSYRPKDNQVAQFFMRKTQAAKSGWAKECPHPPFGSMGYVKPKHVEDIQRLKDEIDKVNPKMIVAMGACALWALTDLDKIGKYRGVQLETNWEPKRPVIGTWHPAAVMRRWGVLPQAVADISKAKKIMEGTFEQIDRTIYIEPSLRDLDWFYDTHIKPLRGTGRPLAVDIETSPPHNQITCIGFAPTWNLAMVVPIWDKRKPGTHYWKTEAEECEALMWIKSIIEDPTIVKVGQNFNYDIQWMRRDGIKLKGHWHDTMLIHYCLEPELEKSLGVLASLYTNTSPWKQMVSFKAVDQGKKDA